jgi:hypothetical protein
VHLCPLHALLSIVAGLRVSDAASVVWAWLGIPQFVTFFDKKVNRRVTTIPITGQLEVGRAYLFGCRPVGVSLDQPIVPGGPDKLQRVLHQVLRPALCWDLCWHAFRRMGAAAFMASGGSFETLRVWFRWRSLRQPREYSAAPAGWVLATGFLIPVPSGNPDRPMDEVAVAMAELWPSGLLAGKGKGPSVAPLPTVRPDDDEASSEESDFGEDLPDHLGQPEEDSPAANGGVTASGEGPGPERKPAASRGHHRVHNNH